MMDPPLCVQGALWVTPQSGRVHGWCLLPASPTQRATVDIVVDGKQAGAIVAAQYFDGAGDGRHGFSLGLQRPLSGAGVRVVEARERSSGTIFARVLLRPELAADPLERRLDAIDRTFLRGKLGAWANPPPANFRTACAGLARTLLENRPGAAARAADSHRSRAVRLALSDQPLVSVVLPVTGGGAAALDGLIAAQEWCDTAPTELMVVDDGADPATFLLCHSVPGLIYLRHTNGCTGAVLNQLAAAARGQNFCVLAAQRPPAPWRWPDLAASPHAVHVGADVAAGLGAMPPGPRPAIRRAQAHGMSLALPMRMVKAAGGFEPSLGLTAACADIAWKCGLLNEKILVWLDRVGPGRRARATDLN